MILVDANIILYAEDQASPKHERARQWWDLKLSGTQSVCLAWITCLAYIRITTNPRAVQSPLALHQALETVDSWLAQPPVRIVQPTEKHWNLLQKMLTKGQAVANLSPDAHLAALAIEHGCELCSTDADFSRFPGLKWQNPLA